MGNIQAELSKNNLKAVFGESKDVIFRDIYINSNDNISVILLYIDGLVNHEILSECILKPLTEGKAFTNVSKTEEALKIIKQGAVYYTKQKFSDNINTIITDVLNGSAALVFEREKTAVIFNVLEFEKRSVQEPSNENVIKGSKDSFVESLKVNTATVRRKIINANLRYEEKIVGRQTNTTISIVYINGITNTDLISEVKKRLENIDVDEVTSGGFIEEYIIDNKYSTFPQVVYTERPDKFCSSIVSGRVGILVDGLPVAYLVPVNIEEFLHAPEDYSQNFIISSLVRMLRYVAMFIALFMPGFYVSFVTYHFEMIPTKLALAIQASKEGIPFPSFMELIFMLLAFEMLQEAGLRLPKSIGQTISIVGALVVGEAAVNARLVSQSVVVIVAITAIASYMMPNLDFNNTLRIWRLIITLLGSVIGIFGVVVGIILILYEVAKLESFGVPYLSPFIIFNETQLENSLFRLPLSLMKKRPLYLKTRNKQRRG